MYIDVTSTIFEITVFRQKEFEILLSCCCNEFLFEYLHLDLFLEYECLLLK